MSTVIFILWREHWIGVAVFRGKWLATLRRFDGSGTSTGSVTAGTESAAALRLLREPKHLPGFYYLCSSMFGLENWGLLGLFIGNILAATVVPFSSDALYIAVLAAIKKPLACFVVGTAGNWLGSLITYYMGRLGRWEWIEKWFKVKPETLEKQKAKVDKYGVWLALIAWVPVVGDVFVLALGFYRTPPGWTAVLLLVGKALRFLAWTLIFGLF